MINKYSVTSNNVKLLKHLDNLKGLQDGKSSPVMFHISPTNLCNMLCSHCCFSGRRLLDSLDKDDLLNALSSIKNLGVGAVEFTGGGEPTLYKDLPAVVKAASELGFSIGLCTNALVYRDDLDYSLFDWVRVSLNIFDMAEKHSIINWFANVKKIQKQTKVSACYVAGRSITLSKLVEVFYFANELKIQTRIAPDCIQPKKNIRELLDNISIVFKDQGWDDNKYVFLSDFNVSFDSRPDNNCYIHGIKPFLFSDGFVYSCPSSELSVEHNRMMPKEFRLCKIGDITSFYNTRFLPIKRSCSYCKYSSQNNLVNDCLVEVEDDKFV